MPNGMANICTGTGGPCGKCDNNTMTPSCTSVCPGSVGGSAMLCKGDGQYCLVTGADGNFDFWAVTCRGGGSSKMPNDVRLQFDHLDSGLLVKRARY
jgi:hypothetical protein